jgi:hypothetical protein
MREMFKNRKTHLLVAAIAIAVAPQVSLAGDTAISGYLSAVGGVLDDTPPVPYAGYTEEDITFDTDSLVGIQLVSKVSDKLTATVQLVARGSNDWQAQADWAYVSYQATENWKVRAGRFRVPFYLYSDFITVGYAYPWIRPPVENYSLPFDNVSGVDTIYTTNFGNVDLLLQAYFGTGEFEIKAGALTGSPGFTRNQIGFVGELSWSNFKFRLAHHQADVTVNASNLFVGALAGLNPYNPNSPLSQAFPDNAARLLNEEDKTVFQNVGLQWDNGRFLFVAEKNFLTADDQALNADQERTYAMAGVRFGDFLVHYTWAERDDTAPNLSKGMPTTGAAAALTGGVNAVAASLVQASEQNTIGVRWDFTPSAAFKVEYTMQEDNKSGIAHDVNLLRFGVQSVF